MEHVQRWKPVTGMEGRYEVSDMGSVRSLRRTAKTAFGSRTVRARVMLASLKKSGYMEIALASGNESRYIYKLVHRLVLEAFHGFAPAGHEAGHVNGIRTDNRLENLRWVTRTENMRDQYLHGTRIVGERCGNSVLNDELAQWIRESNQSGASIAGVLGLSVSTVCRARKGATYAMTDEIVQAKSAWAQGETSLPQPCL